MTIDLTTLRQQIKLKLQSLPPEIRASSSQHIAVKIIASKIFTQSQNIACYVPIENEVDTWPIIKTIWQQNKNCYLPAFLAPTKNQLCFVKFMPDDQLLQIKYKILEPKIIPEKIISPQDLDLAIVPLIGFNGHNFRLGRGAGCYDRTFAFKHDSKTPIKPYLIGVGYKCQLIKFDPSPWDVVMDEIVSG